MRGFRTQRKVEAQKAQTSGGEGSVRFSIKPCGWNGYGTRDEIDFGLFSVLCSYF